MKRFSFFLSFCLSFLASNAQEVIKPSSIVYKSKLLIANSETVRFKEDDSLIVRFSDGLIYSNMSEKADLSHLTDVKKRIRYSNLESQQLFKIEKVNPDTTYYDFTYVKLRDTLIYKNYIGYKHKFTMRDKFNGTTYTVTLYECPEIEIDPIYAKYYFSELFFMKVPIKLHGGVIKALAEMKIGDRVITRGELLLHRFNDDKMKGDEFIPPIQKGYRLMLPDSGKKDRQRAQELANELSGNPNYPSVPYRSGMEHE